MKAFEKDSISRLAVAFLELEPSLVALGEKAFEIINRKLEGFTVQIICGESIKNSVSQQAALLTAINVGKRCYKGGVFVQIDQNIPSLISWPEKTTLNDIISELGARISPRNSSEKSRSVSIALGESANKDHWQLYVNNWCAGVVPPGHKSFRLEGDQSFPLGGIFGGALVIGMTFLKLAGFDYSIGSELTGLSLWRPDLKWHDVESNGPIPESIPDKIWLLGLGHLGQAYAWTLGLMPYKNPSKLLVKLQDDQRLVKGNYDSGMLSELQNEGEYKTRVVAKWLEARGIKTIIVERKYDDKYWRQQEDPKIILVGVDSIEVRKKLKTEEFKIALDCGLGSGLNFDLIRFNAFPNNGIPPEKLWEKSTMIELTPALKELSQKITGCGYTVGIASAFTGCVSSCIMISELLRSANQGVKLSHLYLSIRELSNLNFGFKSNYGTEAFAGVTNLKNKQS